MPNQPYGTLNILELFVRFVGNTVFQNEHGYAQVMPLLDCLGRRESQNHVGTAGAITQGRCRLVTFYLVNSQVWILHAAQLLLAPTPSIHFLQAIFLSTNHFDGPKVDDRLLCKGGEGKGKEQCGEGHFANHLKLTFPDRSAADVFRP